VFLEYSYFYFYVHIRIFAAIYTFLKIRLLSIQSRLLAVNVLWKLRANSMANISFHEKFYRSQYEFSRECHDSSGIR